jgi:hypothetical protein
MMVHSFYFLYNDLTDFPCDYTPCVINLLAVLSDIEFRSYVNISYNPR